MLAEPAASAEATTPSDRALFGSMQPQSRRERDRDGFRERRSHGGEDRAEKATLKKTENAYKVVSVDSMSREQELRRSVQSRLNKICPENVQTIVEQLVSLEVRDVGELELIISLIFKKALAEPHYCETYADLVYSMKSELPEFPSPTGGKPVTFKASLLHVVQEEFEAIPKDLAPAAGKKSAEEAGFQAHQDKKRVLANMRFIGNLFLRQLLSSKVVSSVLLELVLCDTPDLSPVEHLVECACELLGAVGYTLEASPVSAAPLSQVCTRLSQLRKRRAGNQDAYSKRIQFLVQDVLEMRTAGWTKKVFKNIAKTKEEIRLEQERGQGNDGSSRVVAGARPSCVQGQMGR